MFMAWTNLREIASLKYMYEQMNRSVWYLNDIVVAEVIVFFESFKNCAKIVRWFFFSVE